MATLNDIYNLLNGNAPYPGDSPNLYAITATDVASIENYVESIDANLGGGNPTSWDNVYKAIGDVFGDLVNVIEPAIGTPYTPTATLFNMLRAIEIALTAVASDVSAIKTKVGTIEDTLGYATPPTLTVRQDFINTRTAFSIVDTLNTLFDIRFGGGSSTWGNALDVIAAYFKDTTGVLKPVSQQSAMLAQGLQPSLNDLTIGTEVAITSDLEVTLPVGCYGLRFAFNVPNYWGKRPSNPPRFLPPIGWINYASTIGWLNNPIPVEIAFPIAYPLQPAAYSFTVYLETGITGSYFPLLLPH